MNPDINEIQHTEKTDKIKKVFYKVYGKLGYGFLEKVYVNAMMIELGREGIPATAQFPIQVFYENEIVGEYFADILGYNRIIVEIKAAKSSAPENEAQLRNDLKATDVEVGLLLNFGPKPEIKRKLFDNSRKESVFMRVP
jgi:GxxExxY protein